MAVKKAKKTKKTATRARAKAPVKPRVVVPGPLSERDAEYIGGLLDLVTLLKSGWFTAREAAAKLDVSHQTPYSRMKKLRELGFKIEERDDKGIVRTNRRFHIEPETSEKALTQFLGDEQTL